MTSFQILNNKYKEKPNVSWMGFSRHCYQLWGRRRRRRPPRRAAGRLVKFCFSFRLRVLGQGGTRARRRRVPLFRSLRHRSQGRTQTSAFFFWLLLLLLLLVSLVERNNRGNNRLGHELPMNGRQFIFFLYFISIHSSSSIKCSVRA